MTPRTVDFNELEQVQTAQTPAASTQVRTESFAQNIQDEVVLDLRSGWLSDVEANPTRHSPKPVTWRMRLRRDFEPIVEEFAYWLDCTKELALRTITPKPKDSEIRQIRTVQRERKAEEAARLLTTVLVVVAAFGTVLYVAIAARVLDLRRISDVLQH